MLVNLHLCKFHLLSRFSYYAQHKPNLAGQASSSREWTDERLGRDQVYLLPPPPWLAAHSEHPSLCVFKKNQKFPRTFSHSHRNTVNALMYLTFPLWGKKVLSVYPVSTSHNFVSFNRVSPQPQMLQGKQSMFV